MIKLFEFLDWEEEEDNIDTKIGKSYRITTDFAKLRNVPRDVLL